MDNKKQVQTKVSNFLEFDGMQISVEEIRDKILNRHSDEKIRELQIYYNIEEFKAYYVINGVHEKEYYVEVNGPLDEDAVETFKRGVVFHGGYQCKPSTLTILESSDTLSRATVTISEGKFHQVKKMFLCVGVKVTYLKRIRFGEFVLDEALAPGEYRELNEAELQLVKTYF